MFVSLEDLFALTEKTNLREDVLNIYDVYSTHREPHLFSSYGEWCNRLPVHINSQHATSEN